MSGSQALEVAIGLVLMLFLVSLIASAIVEIGSQALKKRAHDLEKVLFAMIGDTTDAAVPGITETVSYRTLKVASGQKPSYMSAKAFSDAVIEILAKAREGVTTGQALFAKLPTGLQAKLRPLLVQVEADLTSIRAEIESWFDDTMDRLAGAYKRWSQWLLCGVGLVLAIGANASAIGVATKLWHDPVTRATVSQAATSVVTDDGKPLAPTDLKEIVKQIDGLSELGLPVGWKGPDAMGKGTWAKVGNVLGWFATALLVMLGAPFWFDVLTRLVSLRGAGPKPPRAPDDPTSATAQVVTARSARSAGALAAGLAAPPSGVVGAQTPEDRLFQVLA